MDDRALRWSTTPSGRLPFLEFGDPDGPPVLVVPGLSDGLLPLSEEAARRAMPRPPERLRDRRVLVVSHRHPVTRGTTTHDLATDLATVIEQEVGGPVVVAGHSMGSLVAQHLAADRPDLVDALVLSATTPAADDTMVERLSAWEQHLTSGRLRDFLRDALSASYTGRALLWRRITARVLAPPEVDHLVDRHLALSLACRSHDARGRLASIAAPTLVLAGARDPVVLPHRSRAVADALPDARLVVLPGVAHGFPEQARRRYVDALVDFLDGRAVQDRRDRTAR